MREMLGVFFLLFHCLFVISRALLWDVAVIRILCICQCVCPSRLSILDEKNGMCVCLLCYLTCGWQWIWHTDEVIVKNFWEFVLDSSLASSSILKFIAKIQREWSRKRNEAHRKKKIEKKIESSTSPSAHKIQCGNGMFWVNLNTDEIESKFRKIDTNHATFKTKWETLLFYLQQ